VVSSGLMNKQNDFLNSCSTEDLDQNNEGISTWNYQSF
jgi:hypothetical protein